YTLVRKIPTRIGNIDLAPLIIVLALQFLDIFLGNILRSIL
ncbi:YggT family protein, partial [Campylobacter jejuni]|nr:YggT family protein [Campylobacter jejuni]